MSEKSIINQEPKQQEKGIEVPLERVLRKLRPFFEKALYIPHAQGNLLIKIPTPTERDQFEFLQLIDLLNISGWEEEGEVQIDGKHDITRLRLAGLLEEKFFVEDRSLDNAYNPYAFPLIYGKAGVAEKKKGKHKINEEGDTLIDTDIELSSIIEKFDQGKTPTHSPTDFDEIGFLKRISSRYRWANNTLFDNKEGREISKEERNALLEKAKNGNKDSLDKSLRINIPLIYFVFTDFIRSFPTNNSNSLLAAGFEGLWKAIQKNDPSKGSFSTYAVIWIESEMRRAWQQESGSIHIPAYVFTERNRFHMAERGLSNMEESEKQSIKMKMAGELGVKSLADFKNKHLIGTQYEDVHDNRTQEAYAEYLQTRQDESPEMSLEKKKFAELINAVLDTLTQREKKLLRLRFYDDRTLEEVAATFDVSRERLRQIEAKALRKMRHPSRSESLQTFLEDNRRGGINIPDEVKIVVNGRYSYVSKNEFEDVVMEMFDKRMKTPKEIAEALNCEQLWALSTINKKMYERGFSIR